MPFGLDIGAYSCKVIQCQKRGKGYILQGWGETTPFSALASLDQQDRVSLAETIKKLVYDAKITSKDVIVALPEAKVYSRVIQLPTLSEAELASAIEFEAEQYVPLPLEEVQLEYLVLSQPPKEAIGAKMEVLLIAAQKKAIDDTLGLLELAGLVSQILETETLAVARALAIYPDTSLLINFGRDSSDLTILQGQDLKFVYSFPTGGQTLTRALSQNLSLDLTQAEEYKKAYGLEESFLEGKVAAALQTPFTQIVTQIQKTINFYMQKSPINQEIRRLILSGATAEMPGITTFLTKAVGLETVLGNPFANFEKGENFPKDLFKKGARFATAVGLAMREV